MKAFKCFLASCILAAFFSWSPAAESEEHHAFAQQLASRITLTAEENAWIKQAPIIRFRVAENPPEQSFENGTAVGLSVDYAKTICATFKLRCEFIPYLGGTFAESLQRIGKPLGPDVMLTGRPTPEREALALFTKPYLFTPSVILTRKTGPNIFSLAELSGKKVLIERGYVIAKLLKDSVPSIELLVVDTTTQALESLAGGIGDAYIGNLTTSTFLVAKLNLANLKVAAPTNFPIQGESMMVRLDYPELVSLIDKVFAALTPGEKQQLQNYWYSLNYGDREWRSYGITVSLAAGVLAVVLAILLLLNRQLRIQAQKTTKQLKRLQDTLPGALYEYKIGADGIGEFLYFSESIHAVTGYDAHVLLGSHNLLTNRIHHGDLPRFSSAITISRDTGKPFFVEVRLQVADGSWKWLQMNAAAQSEDYTTTWSGHILDITERKRLEMTADRALVIQQENEAIARLLKEKEHLVTTMLHDNSSVVTDALSASIAHELNQPLGASSLNIQFLKRQLERDELPPSLNREILNNLDDDNQRAANFIKSLRSIFLDSTPASSVLDLNAQIQEVLGILRSAISAANISLDLQFSAGLHVVIQKNDLQKVLLNIINNAIESLRAGSSTSGSNESNTITLSSSRVGESVFLSVTDNGRGIPTEQSPSLFELLAGNQDKATGVGLWLCQHIIHRYAGKIWHEQPNTTGCRFVIELPSYLGSSNLQRLP
jgi:PAS domain S-box-containing protein